MRLALSAVVALGLLTACTADDLALLATAGKSAKGATAARASASPAASKTAAPAVARTSTAKPATAAPPADPAAKRDLTPSFYQEDSTAGFENGGENYCAPTAVSDALIYLALGRGLKDLVPGTDHDGQVDLVKQLADQMGTDPAQGTPPSYIMDGIAGYADAHKYTVKRLEVATWRSLSNANNAYKTGDKPDLAAVRAAVQDPDTVVLFGVGWYKTGDGGYTRDNGHWVDVVGVGDGDRAFQLRNPAIEAADETKDTDVTLSPVESGFQRLDSDGNAVDMTGYYALKGPGLPYGKSISAAVLDATIIFQLERAE